MNKEKQGQWRNYPSNCTIGKEKNNGFSNYNHFHEDKGDKKIAYLSYAGKLRKCAVKTKPVNRNLNSVLKCRNLDEKPMKKPDPYEYNQFVGSNVIRNLDEKPMKKSDPYEYNHFVGSNVLDENMWVDNEDEYDQFVGSNVLSEEWINSVETRMSMLKEFRKVYRGNTEVMKPSVRRDMIARKKMMQNYWYFEPTQTIGHVPAVKIGDQFDLRIELMIMGLHFQLIHGIDFMVRLPNKMLATSVVATEGYDDNLMDNDVVWYKGEGGNFESGVEKGKMVKDQVWKGGNLALKNSMRARNDVRVIRGLRCGWDKKVVFVYDGLYKVDDCREICGPFGNKRFEFKLVRNPGQKHINWSRYRYYYSWKK